MIKSTVVLSKRVSRFVMLPKIGFKMFLWRNKARLRLSDYHDYYDLLLHLNEQIIPLVTSRSG